MSFISMFRAEAPRDLRPCLLRQRHGVQTAADRSGAELRYVEFGAELRCVHLHTSRTVHPADYTFLQWQIRTRG